MLYNPHWNAPSLESFEYWLESKDPQETYVYTNCSNCACAQYLKAMGKYDDKWLAKAPLGSMARKLNMLASDSETSNPDFTFGGLLARTRKARMYAV